MFPRPFPQGRTIVVNLEIHARHTILDIWSSNSMCWQCVPTHLLSRTLQQARRRGGGCTSLARVRRLVYRGILRISGLCIEDGLCIEGFWRHDFLSGDLDICMSGYLNSGKKIILFATPRGGSYGLPLDNKYTQPMYFDNFLNSWTF